VALNHHERWDGKGYPNGLSKEEIPLCGRIMAICDVYDALISRRCYKQPFSHEKSMQIGKHLARYVQDGDTLQLGIGSIPNAILKNLNDKQDLGIHSEMISDGVIELYQNGKPNKNRPLAWAHSMAAIAQVKLEQERQRQNKQIKQTPL